MESNDIYAYMRGSKVLVVLTNIGYGFDQIVKITTNFESNIRVCNVLDEDDCLNVFDDRSIHVHI